MRSKAVLMSMSECRDLRHAWVNWRGHQEGKTFIRILQCERCGTQRVETLDTRGRLKKSATYRYNPEYKIEGGPLTAEERGAIRLMSMQASFEG